MAKSAVTNNGSHCDRTQVAWSYIILLDSTKMEQWCRDTINLYREGTLGTYLVNLTLWSRHATCNNLTRQQNVTWEILNKVSLWQVLADPRERKIQLESSDERMNSEQTYLLW